ncbi:MAG: hypothetical protein QXD43_05425 [Candidatus Aenigmatarchaeota archaeon]
MKKILIGILLSFVLFEISYAQGLPFGTPRVLYIHPVPCLNGGFMIYMQPPSGMALPSGPYFVPLGTNRYLNFIFPPIAGTKMLGWYIPGGVCWQPGFPSPYPVFTVGTITGYGSALGF